MNKYRIETSGKTCHYQIANLKDNEVNDIDLGEMGYGEIEENFLWAVSYTHLTLPTIYSV